MSGALMVLVGQGAWLAWKRGSWQQHIPVPLSNVSAPQVHEGGEDTEEGVTETEGL